MTVIDPSLLKIEEEEFELALKVSMQAEEERKHELDEEEQLLKMVMEASLKEEEARVERVKQIEEKEQEIIHKVEEVSKKEVEESDPVKLVEKMEAPLAKVQ